MSLRWQLALAPLLVAATLVACAAPQEEGDASSEDAISATVNPTERQNVERTDISGFKFDHLTPTGTHLFKGMVYWRDHQIEDLRYPVARMCASNVSKALFLGGVKKYNAEGVFNLVRSVGNQGGRVHRLPMPTTRLPNGRWDKTEFIAELNKVDHGRIPTGAIVAGCLTPLCDAQPGEQHISIIGNVDPDGTVWIWHNNWYRPENVAPDNTTWKPWMIYSENHDLYLVQGLKRQWMPTPWLRIKRDLSGSIIDAVSLVPAIDDMDPFGTPATYFMTLAIPSEIVAELNASP